MILKIINYYKDGELSTSYIEVCKVKINVIDDVPEQEIIYTYYGDNKILKEESIPFIYPHIQAYLLGDDGKTIEKLQRMPFGFTKAKFDKVWPDLPSIRK